MEIHIAESLALRYFMTETLFDMGDDVEEQVESVSLPDTRHPPLVTLEKNIAHETVTAVPTNGSFKYFGGNKRRFLFLTNDSQHDWMSVAAFEAFLKTLTALKLTADDVAVFNVAGMQPFPKKDDVFSYFNPSVLISFGVSLPWPGLDGPLTGTVTDQHRMRVFRTHAFDTFLVDAEKKRLFWATIKNLLT